MKNVRVSLLLAAMVFWGCSGADKLQIHYQVTGGIQTNCYLIYDSKSKEAALIDVAGRVESLVVEIRRHDLQVKYFLFTHGHFDHIIGLPVMKKLFPRARVVLHELDYRDIFTQMKWAEENLGADFIEYLKSDPERKIIYEFDPRTFPEPDIFPQDGQVLKVGSLKIKVYHTPGHSPGSVSYHIGDHLFSGDVLFYRTVGRTDMQHGSRQDLIKTVKQLYGRLPDRTRVYPGHGKFTDIGSEKLENSRISIYGGDWL